MRQQFGSEAPFCCKKSPRTLNFTVGGYQNSLICIIVFKRLRLRASTRIRTCCVFKSFHTRDRFQKFTVTVGVFTGYVWTLSVTATKCLRMQTNPDTCGQGLNPICSTLSMVWNNFSFTLSLLQASLTRKYASDCFQFCKLCHLGGKV